MSPFSTSPLEPGFMVIHANRLEDLRTLVVEWTRRQPLGPLENETLLVQSNGIAQWLKLALAASTEDGGSGIAAALTVTLPARFLWQAYRAVLTDVADDNHVLPSTSPFDKSRLVWRLMRLLPDLMTQDAYAPLARFLDDDANERKHFQLAQRLADLLDQYQVYRADWLDAWAAGHDVITTARGASLPLDAQRWQPLLWRALREDVRQTQGEAGLASSRAEVHRRFLTACGALAGQPVPPGVPRRIIVFGISSLPQQTLEALSALSSCCQVLLCVHNPCEFYWADIIADKDLLRAERRRQRRKANMPDTLDVLGTGEGAEALHVHAQPLLAAWGKQGRDYLRLLDEHDDAHTYQARFEQHALRIDMFRPFADQGEGRLLTQLQDDIRALRSVEETRCAWPAVKVAHDDSLVFHVTHGAQREVEVLHDQLLAAFSADPTLRPRDILVMVPDIDTYAPSIEAVFGQYRAVSAGRSHDARYIPYALSDQTSRHHQPLMVALERVLRLPEWRLSVSDLLDLLDVPALRRRFGLQAQDLPVLKRWIEGAGIRWGLHAEQRAGLDLPHGLTQNTWFFGLRRLLLGYCVGDSPAWQGIEPFDDIGGLEASLAGPLASVLDALETTWERLRAPTDAVTWCTRLRDLLETFFLSEEAAETVLLTQLEQGVQQFHDSTQEAHLDTLLPLSTVREAWLSHVDEHRLTQRFMAGAVNFATLMPMRAIPFRRVCLLGMNDGEYPRVQPSLDVDLMGRDYRPGDRSRREDDRYLFLEALLSAREQLYISWVGYSQNDNTLKPPSVLVGQLRDHLATAWRSNTDIPLLEALTTVHPLQPFSRAYFPSVQATHPASARLFTYAQEWRTVHDSPADEASGAPLLDSAPLSSSRPLPVPDGALPECLPRDTLDLVTLGRFLRSPVAAFFQHRLGLYFEREAVVESDSEPFDLNGLENWQLQSRLMAAQRQAVDSGGDRLEALENTLTRMEGQGVLAIGAFGERMKATLVEPMAPLFEAYEKALATWPQATQTLEHLSFSAGPVLLEDWLGDVRHNVEGARGRVLLSTSNVIKEKRYQWRHLFIPWVAHLAGNLTAPLTTQLLSKAGHVTLAPLTTASAEALLTDLLVLWHDGMQAPLPLAEQTAYTWWKKQGTTETNTDSDAYRHARKTYESGHYHHGEVSRSTYLAHQWPDVDTLLAARTPQGHGFATLTERIYAPLFRHVTSASREGRA